MFRLHVILKRFYPILIEHVLNFLIIYLHWWIFWNFFISVAFFNELFRRYLQYVASGPIRVSKKSSKMHPSLIHRLQMRCLCLHAMAVVYGRCFKEIGPVSDIPLLVYLLDRCTFGAERDGLLMLFDKLVLNKV